MCKPAGWQAQARICATEDAFKQYSCCGFLLYCPTITTPPYLQAYWVDLIRLPLWLSSVSSLFLALTIKILERLLVPTWALPASAWEFPVSYMVLNRMKEATKAYLGKMLTHAIAIVTTYINNAQRQATKDASTIAGLTILRIANGHCHCVWPQQERWQDLDHSPPVFPRSNNLLRSTSKNRLSKGINLDEALVYDSAIQRNILPSEKGVQDIVLIDTTSGVFAKLILHNTVVLTKKSQIFSTATVTSLASSSRTTTSSASLSAPPSPPSAQCGVPQIKTESITITSEKGRLSKEEINRMVLVTEEFTSKDKAQRKRIEALNQI
ncbi:hypothetical protein BDV93DRAFT_506752 [Ceratobasidium sp. AG-I]|nr:hypothetical protein BDV93DRAFT_506752 [Ceratobasidium sp. AG-I]